MNFKYIIHIYIIFHMSFFEWLTWNDINKRPWVSKVHSRIKSFCTRAEDVLIGKKWANEFNSGFSFDKEKRDAWFHGGIPGAEEKEKWNTSFKKWVNEKEMKMHANENIDIASLSPTKFRTIKVERLTYAKSECFDEKWTYKETLSRGTTILIDTDKPIYSRRDVTTGRLHSFVAIKWYIYKNARNEEFVTSAPGFIRTSWLDSRLQEERKKPVESPKETTSPRKVRNSFDWYMWPDGREIPSYILKAVTANYFWKAIVPKIAINIAKTDAKIKMVRDIMKTEYLTKKIPLTETTGYKVQLKQIAEKSRMQSLQDSIKSFSMDGNTTIIDPNIDHILTWLKKTPKWQEILVQSGQVYKAKRRWL